MDEVKKNIDFTNWNKENKLKMLDKLKNNIENKLKNNIENKIEDNSVLSKKKT